MLSTNVRGGKAFAAEQKIREIKKRIISLKAIEKRTKKTRIKQNQIIRKVAENMNNLLIQKYSIARNEIEKKSIESERFREWFDIKRVKVTDQVIGRLRTPLDVGEEVLNLSGRIKKKDIPGRFYTSSVENRLYFNKDTTYLITNRQNIDE